MIDAHLHVWAPAPGRYGWLDRPAMRPIARRWDAADALAELCGESIDGVVLVQADNAREDTDLMLRTAQEWDAVLGIVAWAPLEDPRALAAALPLLCDDPRIVGVRHLNHDEPDPAWLARPSVQAGLETLAAHGLTFDVVAVTERHLRDAAAIAAANAELTVVVDHLGSPPVAARGWEPWAAALAALAREPNAVLKVSGLGTLCGDRHDADALRPYLDHARRLFGADRLMYGGDWPTCRLASSYREMLAVVRAAVASWSAAEHDALFARTAARAYGLDRSA